MYHTFYFLTAFFFISIFMLFFELSVHGNAPWHLGYILLHVALIETGLVRLDDNDMSWSCATGSVVDSGGNMGS